MLANLAQTITSDAAISNDTLVFKQTDSDSMFLLDPTSTHGDPAYPTLNSTEHFYVAGTWLQPAKLDHVRFQCHLFGALVYNETQADAQDFNAGDVWTSPAFDFDIPAIAPSTTYVIDIIGETADNTELWSVNTQFKF